jgi:phosphatidylinositol-3-phosphatase
LGLTGAFIRKCARGCLALLFVLAWAGCGGGTSPAANSVSNPPAAPCIAPAYDSTQPFAVREQHAFVVVLENHSFETVFNNSQMPYLNGLARQYAYAAGYFADAHPSLPNYLALTAGQTLVSNDTFTSTVTDDNIVRQLILAGKTWKEYSEGLPSVGYDGGDSGFYVQHHNPLSYFSDVRDDSSQAQNLVPFTQLATDLANHQLPDYAFIVPDVTHDGHSCLPNQLNCTDGQKLAASDAWLQQNIAPLISSSDLSSPGSGIVIIVYDESADTDTRQGGGRVLWVAAGADVRKGYFSSVCYQHENTLRFMARVLGLSTAPAGASTAADMREFLLGN